MPLRLNTESVTAVDDGGFALAINIRGFRPVVLSIEVPLALFSPLTYPLAKRKKSKKLTDIETHYMHAAQIYAEMLAQVCHRELYDNPYSTYQEVTASLLYSW